MANNGTQKGPESFENNQDGRLELIKFLELKHIQTQSERHPRETTKKAQKPTRTQEDMRPRVTDLDQLSRFSRPKAHQKATAND